MGDTSRPSLTPNLPPNTSDPVDHEDQPLSLSGVTPLLLMKGPTLYPLRPRGHRYEGPIIRKENSLLIEYTTPLT